MRTVHNLMVRAMELLIVREHDLLMERMAQCHTLCVD